MIRTLARPGINVTGFTNYEFSTSGKWLELLKEMAPGIAKVAVIFNPKTAPYASGYLRPLQAAATSLGMELMASGVVDASQIERIVAEAGRGRDGGLMTLPDFSTGIHRELIIALAARHRVPAVYHYRFFAASGGLMSYGIDITEQFGEAASYVDRILRGEKPADMPVQAPTKYELVINLKTAKTLGLEVPWFLQQRADLLGLSGQSGLRLAQCACCALRPHFLLDFVVSRSRRPRAWSINTQPGLGGLLLCLFVPSWKGRRLALRISRPSLRRLRTR